MDIPYRRQSWAPISAPFAGQCPAKPGAVMNRWPIWILVLALCGCQAPDAGRSDADCPTPSLCGDPDSDARLAPAPPTSLANWAPVWPGCPTTLQVMARAHPIVFHTIGPAPEPATAPDDAEWS